MVSFVERTFIYIPGQWCSPNSPGAWKLLAEMLHHLASLAGRVHWRGLAVRASEQPFLNSDCPFQHGWAQADCLWTFLSSWCKIVMTKIHVQEIFEGGSKCIQNTCIYTFTHIHTHVYLSRSTYCHWKSSSSMIWGRSTETWPLAVCKLLMALNGKEMGREIRSSPSPPASIPLWKWTLNQVQWCVPAVAAAWEAEAGT